MTDLISLDRFRSELRAGGKPSGEVLRVSIGDPQQVAERKFRFCFSDGSVDRMGDTITPTGWVVGDFLKNPVALFAHDSLSPPIGRASNIVAENGRLMGDIEFMPPEIYPFAETIYRMVRERFINAVSVGFMPLEYSFSKDKDRQFGIDFERQELLEISVVPVPANANALIEARAKGIDVRPLVEWAERTLEGGGKVIVAKSELAKLRKSAKSSAADWKCGAARDLPIDDSEAWDGPAAEASIFEHAGGDDFDPAKARPGFLIYNAAEPKLRGSYKLPFAHVSGGELKAVKGGIRAASSRLPQTDASQSALDEAKAVVAHYEGKMGMDGKNAGGERRDGMGEGDPSAGGFLARCNRGANEECGMKDPMECATHAPQDMTDGKQLAALIERVVRSAVKEAAADQFPWRSHRTIGQVIRSEPPDGGDDDGPLAKACEHVDACKECMDAMPDPDEDSDEHDRCVRAMHAHVKAADDYLDQHRSMRMSMVGDPEDEKAARDAILAKLAA